MGIDKVQGLMPLACAWVGVLAGVLGAGFTALILNAALGEGAGAGMALIFLGLGTVPMCIGSAFYVLALLSHQVRRNPALRYAGAFLAMMWLLAISLGLALSFA